MNIQNILYMDFEVLFIDELTNNSCFCIVLYECVLQ